MISQRVAHKRAHIVNRLSTVDANILSLEPGAALYRKPELISIDVAGVSELVLIEIGLIRIGVIWTVVYIIRDAIEIGVNFRRTDTSR